MQDVICFGEILLRFAPASAREDFTAKSMPVYVGGAELNVARALAKWGFNSAYCTAMPDNFLSTEICAYLAKENVDLNAVKKMGERIGIYYLAQGQDVKNAGVVFDRANSSFSQLKSGDIDWNKILKGKKWFHVSAISASLTQNTADVCKEALIAAKDLGLTTSIDLNYREKLWKYGKKPTDIIPALLPYCDVVMGNMWASESLADIASPLASSKGASEDDLNKAAAESIAALRERYKNVQQVIYTFRLEEEYFAVLHNNEGSYTSEKYQIADAVDRVGSGDCFMGGIIYANMEKMPAQDIINFAASAAVGKLYEKGDHTQQSVEEILKRFS